MTISCFQDSDIAVQNFSRHWATLTFDLAFRWAFRERLSERLSQKLKLPNVSNSTDLSQKVKWFRWTKDLGQICGGLSPDFSVQLKVSLSELLSERLSQNLKWPIGLETCPVLLKITEIIWLDRSYANFWSQQLRSCSTFWLKIANF